MARISSSGAELRFVADMKAAVGHAPLAAHGDENQFRLVNQQRGQRIGRRRGIDDISTKRAAILICDSAGPARGDRATAGIRA